MQKESCANFRYKNFTVVRIVKILHASHINLYLAVAQLPQHLHSVDKLPSNYFTIIIIIIIIRGLYVFAHRH